MSNGRTLDPSAIGIILESSNGRTLDFGSRNVRFESYFQNFVPIVIWTRFQNSLPVTLAMIPQVARLFLTGDL